MLAIELRLTQSTDCRKPTERKEKILLINLSKHFENVGKVLEEVLIQIKLNAEKLKQ